MEKLKAMMRTALYRRTFKKFTRTIMQQVQAAEELWEVDEELELLWNVVMDSEDIDAVGEKVDVFVYRMFVTVGDKAYLLENKALVEESIFI